MKTYELYVNDAEIDPAKAIIVLREGVNLPFIFLNIFYALYYRMWNMFFFLLALSLLCGTIAIDLSKPEFGSFLFWGVVIGIGFYLHNFESYYYEQKGYKFQTIIRATSEKDAKLRYLNKTYNRKEE